MDTAIIQNQIPDVLLFFNREASRCAHHSYHFSLFPPSSPSVKNRDNNDVTYAQVPTPPKAEERF